MTIFFLCSLWVFLLLTFVSFIYFARKFKEPKTLNLPPSPPSLPIIGNLHQLAGLLHRCFHHLSIKYGPVVLLHLGSVPTVVISSSEAAEEVLRIHDLGCCNRPKTVATGKLSYGFKDISFSQYGEYWREMRKLAVIELFSLKKVQSFKNIREEEVGFMVKKVSESALEHTPVDLNKAFFSLTASIICRVALGQNFNESGFVIEQDRIEELVRDALVALGTITCSDVFPGGLGRFLDWLSGGHKSINKVFEELDAFYQHVIDDHLKTGAAGKKGIDSQVDIVALLLDMMHKQGKKDYFQLNISNIKAVLMDIFLAGVDTGAVTMIWAMTELVRNPKVMRKAQEEIRTTLGPSKEKITEEDIDKVGYLKHIIKETFRLHPAVPLLLPRETMSHVKINGYDVAPNTQIQLNVWAIGRDPKCWTDPEEFIPERFANSSVDFRGQHFELLPFGSGRRSCPGMPMGVASVELGLLSLLYFFDWELPEGMVSEADIDMEEAGTLTVVKKQPLLLVPVLYH
ncbi:Cytochrome P450 71B2 [Raphanus sativus]|uniref:Cytochrome P450 71B2 n=1 Tax=Raphanus sativus TaxID=3726 RepID=A0A6J0LE96_RAPSA|nr:cytochrome P450 71B2 [Raphanus sativus]KAJ4913643.1 Cytochrome P450 71B2 [Raphanus sativus]